MLTSDPAKNFYKDLVTLFSDFKLGNKKVRQLHIDFITIVKPFNNTICLGRYIYTSDSSSKKTPCKSCNSLDARIGARKKGNKIPKERFAGFDGIISRQKIIKSEDHG